MAGIAGIARPRQQQQVVQMLGKISHLRKLHSCVSGVEDLLARHAETTISDADFQRERKLPNDWMLNTKEELMYYRIFREHFSELENLDWMGRTKGAPVQ